MAGLDVHVWRKNVELVYDKDKVDGAQITVWGEEDGEKVNKFKGANDGKFEVGYPLDFSGPSTIGIENTDLQTTINVPETLGP
jgi:hypothetical protein